MNGAMVSGARVDANARLGTALPTTNPIDCPANATKINTPTKVTN
jgi:hypothetical protein